MPAEGSPARNPWLIAAAFVVIAAGIKAAEAIMVPFLLAAFIATVAATPMFWLHRHRVPIGLAILAVIAGLLVVLFGLGAVVAQQVAVFAAALPGYEAKATAFAQRVLEELSAMGIDFSVDWILEAFNPAVAFSMAGNTLRGFQNVLSNGFLILLTVIFILAEASSFPRKLRETLKVPDRDMPYFERFAENVNRYIAIKTTTSMATGVVVGGSMAVIGVDVPILCGLLAFMLNFVPTIGSIIAAVPAVLLALVELGPAHAAVAVACYVAINVIVGNFVEPKFMGRALSLSTLVVFLSLVFWGWMLGPVGMLLSVPLTMTAKLALEANPESEWLAHLLGPADAPPTVVEESADEDEQ